MSGDPGQVWRVGYEPDPWEWVDWQYAFDNGRFNGRWDDQEASFRTLYTAELLLGCFLELLASARPNDVAFAELEEIEDDDNAVAVYPDPERGAVGMTWLDNRLYGRAQQTGTYAEVTHTQALACLVDGGVFDRRGIAPRDVDVSLLKDPKQRDLTRSVSRFLFNLRDATSLHPAVDGIAFRSRMGDDIRMWAVFERGDEAVSEHITPETEHHRVTEENEDLLQAFTLLGLHWKREI
ncbi:hypothetical protein J2X85_001601 [Microbacterium trichothecenolyticum]|uniref:RES domain-containing protein n=1 Tax=Microbacterium trichothecenolyticum TaxID=69370 RepID=UPI002863A2DA|nr:RES domain-containing protein [Microbacterium trichothecenolyticum]MDR7184578.1 hypothetical protein [Microbacterium trichothecenolyticum]